MSVHSREGSCLTGTLGGYKSSGRENVESETQITKRLALSEESALHLVPKILGRRSTQELLEGGSEVVRCWQGKGGEGHVWQGHR